MSTIESNLQEVHPQLSPIPTHTQDKLAFPPTTEASDVPPSHDVFESLVGLYSSKVTYKRQVRRINNPYPLCDQWFRMHIKVANLAFERHNYLENDLLVLFDYIGKVIVPLHCQGMPQESLHPFARTKYAVRFVRFEQRHDVSMVPNPKAQGSYTKHIGRRPSKMIPAKERHIEVETTYPYLNELLADPRLFILADHHCFHVCWDGMIVTSTEVEAGEEEPSLQKHDVQTMKTLCNDVWVNSSLRGRHRITDGLPCTTIKFAGVSWNVQAGSVVVV